MVCYPRDVLTIATEHLVRVRDLMSSPVRTIPADASIADAKRDLWQARFELSTRQLKDTSVVNKTRKTIARLLMVLAERQAAQKA